MLPESPESDRFLQRTGDVPLRTPGGGWSNLLSILIRRFVVLKPVDGVGKVFGGMPCGEVEHSPEEFSEWQVIRDDDATMRFARRHELVCQSDEIPHVEGQNRAALLRGEHQLLFVEPLACLLPVRTGNPHAALARPGRARGRRLHQDRAGSPWTTDENRRHSAKAPGDRITMLITGPSEIHPRAWSSAFSAISFSISRVLS